MIGIRVDANKEIATGHVMRCLAIASGIKDTGMDCVFIIADENAKPIITANGFKVICLNSQWNQLDKEVEYLIEVIQKYKIDKLIIDSYYVTARYLEQLMLNTKVIYIDDLNLFRYPVSMLINYNIYYNMFPYKEMYDQNETQLLLGCRYAPLRKEFKSVKRSYRNMVKKILITTGGTDRYNVAGKLLNRVTVESLFDDIEFHVVVGKLNIHYDYLRELSQKRKSIVLHRDVKNMSKLMASCDMAITAGGSTMYELCACGTPSICFSFADNQLYGVKGFAEAGIMDYAGDIRDNESECISNIITYTQKYITNPAIRMEKAIKMKELVDGNGVDRIVKAIINL